MCVESEKAGINNLIYKVDRESQMQRTNLWMPVGKAEAWDELGDWDGHRHS